MSYKRGFPYKNYSTNLIEDWDWVWHYGVWGGKTDGYYDPFIGANWKNANRFKRGVILVPMKSTEDDVNENGSFHLQFLQEYFGDLKISNAPIIIDYMADPSSKRYDYDRLVQYVNYIAEHWKIDGAPLPNMILLRANLGTWNTWMDIPETANMLKVVEPLVVRWDALKPEELKNYGAIRWWEYSYKAVTEMGLVAYDSSGAWDKTPNQPVIIPPVEEEPIDEPEPEPIEDDPIVVSAKYAVDLKIKFFGIEFPITGTIERIK